MARGEAYENYLSKQVLMRPEITNNNSRKSPYAYFGFGTVLPYTKF